MPLYEYDCTACRTAFEALVFGAEKATCPKCGSRRVEKRFSQGLTFLTTYTFSKAISPRTSRRGTASGRSCTDGLVSSSS